MLPVLKQAALGESRVPDVANKLADEFGLTPEERDQLLPSKRQQVLNNRIHWAKFYMSKAGLIDQPRRGRFMASEQGRELLARNPSTINNQTLLEYPSFVNSIVAAARTFERSQSATLQLRPRLIRHLRNR
jgi:restriction system protein